MKRPLLHLGLPLAALLALLVFAQGCTTERDPVYRAPYEALDKRLFEGEFFYKMTVVDLPYSVDYSFIGQTSDAMIIRWEITKNWLIAYNIHDNVNAVDSEGNPFNNHTPVLAFPILSHFDIRYLENTITGEDLPVQVPNTDMDWHEAPYLVIDASMSGISTFPDMYMNLIYDIYRPFTREMVGGYWELEFYDREHNYLQPRSFDEALARNANTDVDLISFYTLAIYRPNISFRGWWNWTSEEFFFRLNYEPARVRYRHVFKRVRRDELATNGFVPIDMDDYTFRRFGYFRTNYAVYDEREGLVTDASWYKLANYFNTERDPNNGNRARQIEYYVNPEHPHRLIPASCSIAVDYNQAFREAVFARDNPGATSAQLPTMSAGEQFITDNWNTDDPAVQLQIAEMCLGQGENAIFNDPNRDVYVLRAPQWEPYVAARDGVNLEGELNAVEVRPCDHYPFIALPEGFTPATCEANPAATFQAACELSLEYRCVTDSQGRPVPRYRQRLGDTDTSFIYWVAKPTDYGILGVAQWTAHPETGQIFSGVGHIAGAVMASAMQRAMDQFDYLMELRSLDEIVEADHRGQRRDYVRTTRRVPHEMPAVGDDYLPQPLGRTDLLRVLEQESTRLPPLSGRLPLEAVAGTRWAGRMTPPDLSDWLYPGASRAETYVQDSFGPLAFGSMDSMMRQVNKLEGMTENCYLMADWMDGVIVAYVEEKKLERERLVNEQGMNIDDANAQIRSGIYAEFERLMFKGVAQHEIGHAIGLRHNFVASADETNYIGTHPWEDPEGVGSGYWPAQTEWRRQMDQIRADNPSATGMQLHNLGEQFANQRNRYRYASVMDYQSEPYIHAQGLGRYDIAAIKFVYGRTIEKWEPAGDGGAYLTVKYVPWFDVDTGQIATEPRARLRHNRNGTHEVEWDFGQEISVLDNDNVKPYMFCTDHQRMEDAFCNVFDSGVTGREIARNMIRGYNQFYYYRFFRRGNPRFIEMEWYRYLWWAHFPLAHFALDFNYNFARVDDWWEAVLTSAGNNGPQYTSYMWAVGANGRSEANPGFDDAVYAGSMGDYLTAAMEAFNHFLFNMIYRPDVGVHLARTYDDYPFDERDAHGRYWEKNPYIVPDDRLDEFGSQFEENLMLGIDVGRYHRNRWDIQDDPQIMEERFTRRGFSTEKTAAIFILSNSGWPVDKYRRENMANGFHYASDGFRNAIFQLMADVNNEDAMTTLSGHCIRQIPEEEKVAGGDDEPFELIELAPDIRIGWLWESYDRFDFNKQYSRPFDLASRNADNICQYTATDFEPVYAGWIYFDKLWPTLWSTYGMANTSADQTVFQYFTAQRIPADQYRPAQGEYGIWGPPDPATQVEFLNTANRYWYRATLAPDGRPTPSYELVRKGARIRAMCEARMWSENILPDVPITDCTGWRTLEVMEATLVNNQDYENFWTSITSLIFGR